MGFIFNDCSRRRYYDDCECDERPHPPHPPYPPYPPSPPAEQFRSCYLEAVGSTQDVEAGGNIVFDSDTDYLDIVGRGIELNDYGTVFTITKPGLYHIEWSLNLQDAEQPVVIGLLENGSPVSALSNISTDGNFQSGALIRVRKNDIPFTISLHNFGGYLTLKNPDGFENTAVSIRILRFADAPDV